MEGQSRFDAKAAVLDPRGVRHPLTAIHSLTVGAIIACMKPLATITQFGSERGVSFAHALGFTRGKIPAKSCLSDLYRGLDFAALEAVLALWLQSRATRPG